jgi:hypothetical protein
MPDGRPVGSSSRVWSLADRLVQLTRDAWPTAEDLCPAYVRRMVAMESKAPTRTADPARMIQTVRSGAVQDE